MAEEMRGWVEVSNDRRGSGSDFTSGEEVVLMGMTDRWDDARGDWPYSVENREALVSITGHLRNSIEAHPNADLRGSERLRYHPWTERWWPDENDRPRRCRYPSRRLQLGHAGRALGQKYEVKQPLWRLERGKQR